MKHTALLFLIPVLSVVLLPPVGAHPHPDGHHHHGHGHGHGHEHDHSHGHHPHEEPAADRPPGAQGEARAPWARALTRELDTREEAPELLRSRAVGVPIIVYGTVEEKRILDQGRLHMAKVSLERTYRGEARGEADSSVRVVEASGSRSAPTYMEAGARVFLLLEPAPRWSYLEEMLGEGNYHVLANVQSVPPTGLDREAADTLAQWLALEEDGDPRMRRMTSLAMLNAGHPHLIAHGAQELAQLPAPESLTRDEWHLLEHGLEVGHPARATLARQLARWRLTDAVHLLGVGDGEDAITRARVWEAATRLGAPPELDALRETLEDDDPAHRAAAAPALAARGDRDALGLLGRLATGDEALDVQRVAIAALARTGDLDALPHLTRALTRSTAEDDLRVHIARGLWRFHPALQTTLLSQGVLHAEDPEVREYSARLLVFQLGSEAEEVVALREQLDSERLRHVLTDGGLEKDRVAHDH